MVLPLYSKATLKSSLQYMALMMYAHSTHIHIHVHTYVHTYLHAYIHTYILTVAVVTI